ncbi:MAG: endolytic transglycosylase MltG [bacterium]|nr:endolytic transglycosylase MltG [bacterium]
MYTGNSYKQPEGVLGYVQRRKRSPWTVFAKIVAALIVLAGGVFGLTFVLPQGPQDAAPVAVVIAGSPDEVVRTLRSAGVLRYATAFRVALQLRGSNARAGQYTISPHLSVWSLAVLVTSTLQRQERTLTIIEGWNLRDIAAYLEREGVTDAAALYALTGEPAADYRKMEGATRPTVFDGEFAFLAERSEFVGLEGYLFPDTYRVFDDASAADIVRKLLQNFDDKMTPVLREETAASGRSLHQIVTMASLVEKEVADDAARPIVAGILWKRRDQRWRLQADSTVNYITGKSDPRTRIADHDADSSFNTYKYPGLPHGPISNPGMASILAALRPEATPYWFFLTGTDDTVHYARTLEEHNANVRKYLE